MDIYSQTSIRNFSRSSIASSTIHGLDQVDVPFVCKGGDL